MSAKAPIPSVKEKEGALLLLNNTCVILTNVYYTRIVPTLSLFPPIVPPFLFPKLHFLLSILPIEKFLFAVHLHVVLFLSGKVGCVLYRVYIACGDTIRRTHVHTEGGLFDHRL